MRNFLGVDAVLKETIEEESLAAEVKLLSKKWEEYKKADSAKKDSKSEK